MLSFFKIRDRMRVLTYAETLLGIPYRFWDPDVSCYDLEGPFWAGRKGEVPLKEIQNGHTNCTGFLNLLCLKFNLPIPGSEEKHYYSGGTGLWWAMFEEKGKLVPFEEGKVYPQGTLFLRKYRDVEDQGHVAIVYDDTHIIHSWPEKGIVIEKPVTGYYEAVVLDWFQN